MPPNPKPKSDAIPASRIGPPSPECDRPDCPMKDDLHEIRSKVDEIHTFMFGTPNEPGFFERVRKLEGFQKVVIACLVAIGAPVLGALGIAIVRAINQ